MSSVIVVALLLTFLSFISLLFIYIGKKQKRKDMNQFLIRFSELGILYNLTFSSQEIMQYAAIGLDGIHRMLLVLTGNNESTAFNQLVNLRDVKTCYVKKEYGTIKAGIKQNKLAEYLKKISLCFELKWGKDPVEVVFYHEVTGGVNQIKAMEEKAKYWEAILSKMLKSPLKEAA